MMGGVSVNQAAEIGRVDQEVAAAMGTRPRDAAACISALEKAIALARSDSGAADVFYLPELLDELAELYDQVGRVDDALAAMRQALDEGWRGQPDGRCRLAEILMRGGRVAEAGPIWAQVRADTPGDVWVFNNAGLKYGAIGDHVTALAWLTDGLALALGSGDPERLVGQLLDLRAASLAALDRGPDELQARAKGVPCRREDPASAGGAGNARAIVAWSCHTHWTATGRTRPARADTGRVGMVSRRRVRAGARAVAGADRTGRSGRWWP